MKPSDVGFFERDGDLSIIERALPHWSQAGTLCFITWRTADSLPRKVMNQLEAEIILVLQAEGLPTDVDWKQVLSQRDPRTRSRVQWKLFATRDKYLDAGYGECFLAKPAHADQVLSSLKHFDGDRYLLTDAVVMPNHVHFIAAFASEDAMLKQCQEWKRFIARRINSMEGRRGAVWQIDQFDHLIRSERWFDHFREYIRNNPIVAGIPEGRFVCYQRQLQ